MEELIYPKTYEVTEFEKTWDDIIIIPKEIRFKYTVDVENPELEEKFLIKSEEIGSTVKLI